MTLINKLQLTASLLQLSSLRYTPAGVPVLESQWAYAGEQEEAGTLRQVEFVMQAVVLGDLAYKMPNLALGKLLELSGFLTAKRRNSQTLVFHITEFKEIEKEVSHATSI